MHQFFTAALLAVALPCCYGTSSAVISIHADRIHTVTLRSHTLSVTNDKNGIVLVSGDERLFTLYEAQCVHYHGLPVLTALSPSEGRIALTYLEAEVFDSNLRSVTFGYLGFYADHKLIDEFTHCYDAAVSGSRLYLALNLETGVGIKGIDLFEKPPAGERNDGYPVYSRYLDLPTEKPEFALPKLVAYPNGNLFLFAFSSDRNVSDERQPSVILFQKLGPQFQKVSEIQLIGQPGHSILPKILPDNH